MFLNSKPRPTYQEIVLKPPVLLRFIKLEYKRSTRILYVSIKYSVYDVKRDVIIVYQLFVGVDTNLGQLDNFQHLCTCVIPNGCLKTGVILCAWGQGWQPQFVAAQYCAVIGRREGETRTTETCLILWDFFRANQYNYSTGRLFSDLFILTALLHSI